MSDRARHEAVPREGAGSAAGASATRAASGVPPALQQRIGQALMGAAGDDAHHCLRAGEALLAAVLDEEATSRGTALDLLAADALVTHAFELAAETPAELPALADAAMRRIAALSTAN